VLAALAAGICTQYLPLRGYRGAQSISKFAELRLASQAKL
jgi:hypothetical protein